MVATINLPGSSHFKYFIGNLAECNKWLEEKKDEYQTVFGSTWFGAYSPARITTNADAKTWKYSDGSRVIREL